MVTSANASPRLTPRASEKLKELRGDSPAPILHLYAAGRTCCGVRFGLALAETVAAGYTVTESEGVRLIVDPDSEPYCAGASVDYVETEEGAGFTVDSPVNAGGCSCGHG
jgi:iron-sulfur cluster insertion protein